MPNAAPRLGVNKIDRCPRCGCWRRAVAPLCPCKRPPGKGSSAGPPLLSPWAYNQVTTLGQAVKGRDSISLPGMQLDPAGTRAALGRHGGTARSSAGTKNPLRELKEDLHGWVPQWKGTHGTTGEHPLSRHTSPVSLCQHQGPTVLLSVPRAPVPCKQSMPARPAVTSTVFLAKAMPKGFCAPQASETVSLLHCGQERGRETVTVSLGMVTSYCCPALPAPGEDQWRRWLCRTRTRQGDSRWNLPVPSGQCPGHGYLPAPPHAGGGAALSSD